MKSVINNSKVKGLVVVPYNGYKPSVDTGWLAFDAGHRDRCLHFPKTEIGKSSG